jgi:hypothetical protein
LRERAARPLAVLAPLKPQEAEIQRIQRGSHADKHGQFLSRKRLLALRRAASKCLSKR